MRAVIYGRYSTDLQREASIEDQARNCRRYAEREGWQIAGRYEDKAISGATSDRPGYKQMLADAEARAFDVLLVDDLSRLSRDDIELKKTVRRFCYWGIRIVGVSDGFDTASKGYKVHAGVRGLINEIYLDDLREKVRRGMEGKALKGLNTGGKRYGYRHIPIEDRSRKDAYARPLIESVRLEINPDEAKWVRQIFTWFADGRPPRWIAGELNRLKVPSPRGTLWSASAIYGDNRRGWGLLNNEIYIGRRIWNKTTWIKDPDSERDARHCRQRPASEWVTFDAPELRIVPQQLWERVKARQQEQHAASGAIRAALHKNARTGAGPKFLLSSVLKCAICGSSYAMHDGYRYACSGNASRGDTACPNRLRVSRKVVEERVLAAIRDDLFQPDGIELFKLEVRRLLAERRTGKNADADKAKRDLARVEQEIANIMAAIKAGILTLTTKAELEKAEGERARLERALKIEAPALQNVEDILPRAVDRYRELVENLATVAGKEMSLARNSIKALVGGEILLVPTAQGGLNAVMRGDYRGLVELAENGSGGHKAKAKLSLVAEEGFEPPTRGL